MTWFALARTLLACTADPSSTTTLPREWRPMNPTSEPPAAGVVHILRDTPAAGAPLVCSTDVEGSLVWTVDGAVYGAAVDGALAGDTVSARVTRDGEVWGCAVVRDGARMGADVVTIGAEPTNVLVVLLDDVGATSVGEGHRTPVIDGLAAQGLSFRAAYANPLCSASRAALHTGRYGRRFGVGNALSFFEDQVGISADERTAAEVLGDAGYTTGLIGKWHLGVAADDDPLADPLEHGFDTFDGVLANLAIHLVRDGQDRTYFHWDHVVQGEVSIDERYVVTAQTDAALAFVAGATAPWFAVVAYTGAHTPYHVPPPELAAVPASNDPKDLEPAMVEAVDTELGRLLASIDPEVLARTHVIVTADNGTPAAVSEEAGGGKGTLEEGGVHVPFIVTGPAVRTPGVTTDALVHLVDVLPTVAAMADLDLAEDPELPEIDGVSLWRYLEHPDAAPAREIVYDEMFAPSGFGPYTTDSRSVRDAQYRLVRNNGGESLHHVLPGNLDGPDLLDDALTPRAQEAYARLSEALDGFTARLAPER